MNISQCGGKSFSEMRKTFREGDVSPSSSKVLSKTKARPSASKRRRGVKSKVKSKEESKEKSKEKSKEESKVKSKEKSKEKKSKEKPRRRVSRSLSRKRRTSKEKLTKPKLTKPKHCGCGSHTYTGKEMTPRGLGKCEECIPENVVLRGVDETLYRNKEGTWTKIL